MERRIVLLAHNIRSLWNVGSFFRTADAFSVEKIFLTGYTGTPPRREISKTALGADEWVPWEFQKDPVSVINSLREEGYSIVALEQTEKATDVTVYQGKEKICLLVGHEVTGVPKELLTFSDDHIHIPMCGKKESLNVSVAAGIALHCLTNPYPSPAK
ncbi:RNA methyltransferase [Candidatus Peregrinibacteria bacterium CG10_big_fil_rev_8_21_14_0_10_49_24]|nr:MAG: RNA methyltransferase [Candidatus Peregrinibacteria bacterium CG11_big_fil_rev_8_21_14_0_20_49_14]PIR50384.1 MAG: RNA methyltransferase [Candidatus Peregrinibacteria bacterium CG10_big_fil_rev_8_21_14_0_10_49_24]PJA67473.1 MAG: RNA methyltransferase [Candidatus Peregrinibacteria bacterium CG_4_9_14_3_um_filter_49_12]